MQRYFVNKENIELPYIYITGDDCQHIGIVMRMKPEDKVYVSDQERSFVAKIISFTSICPILLINSFIFISFGPIPFIGDIEPCNTW